MDKELEAESDGAGALEEPKMSPEKQEEASQGDANGKWEGREPP